MLFAFLYIIVSSVETLLFGYVFTFLDPMAFLPLFYGAATLILLPSFLKKHSLRLSSKEAVYKKEFILYLVFGALGNALWFASLCMIGVSSVIILSVLSRLVVVCYGVTKLDEKMSRLQVLCTFLVMLCMVIFSSDSTTNEWLGVLLCCVSYVSYAVSDIAQKKMSRGVPLSRGLFSRQAFQFVLFSLLLLALSASGAVNVDFNEVTVSFVGWVFLLALIGGVISKSLHYKALAVMPLSRYTIIEQVKPLLIFIGGVVLLNESLPMLQVYCGFIILVCVGIVLIEDKSKNLTE